MGGVGAPRGPLQSRLRVALTGSDASPPPRHVTPAWARWPFECTREWTRSWLGGAAFGAPTAGSPGPLPLVCRLGSVQLLAERGAWGLVGIEGGQGLRVTPPTRSLWPQAQSGAAGQQGQRESGWGTLSLVEPLTALGLGCRGAGLVAPLWGRGRTGEPQPEGAQESLVQSGAPLRAGVSFLLSGGGVLALAWRGSSPEDLPGGASTHLCCSVTVGAAGRLGGSPPSSGPWAWSRSPLWYSPALRTRLTSRGKDEVVATGTLPEHQADETSDIGDEIQVRPAPRGL